MKCNQHAALATLSCDSPLSDSDWGESSLIFTLSHFALVYDACLSLFSPNITASSQEVLGPGERRQLAAARRGSRMVHGHPASGSFAQLVALKLQELLHTAGQLPVEASDVEVVVDVGARLAEPREISVPGLLRWRPRGALRQQ